MSKTKRTYVVETSVPYSLRLKGTEAENGKNGTKPRKRRKKRDIVITPDLIWRIIEHIKEL